MSPAVKYHLDKPNMIDPTKIAVNRNPLILSLTNVDFVVLLNPYFSSMTNIL